MLNITVTNRKSNDKRTYKFSQNTILIGRQQNCDIMLESEAVSRRHAKITLNKNLVEVEDTGSGNGTLVNQVRLKANSRQPLTFGDTIRIDEFEIKCHLDDDGKTETPGAESSKATLAKDNTSTVPESSAPAIKIPAEHFNMTDPDILEIKMIKKVLGALDNDKLPSLTIVSDEFRNKSIHFDDGMDEIVVGRDPDCNFQLNSNVISRRHAVISIKWGGYVVTDLNSKNHTYVNGEKIKEKSIKNGDEIVFGTIKAIFKNPQQFDFGALGQSLIDEKNKTKKLEETSSFQVDDLKPAQDPNAISAAAQMSTESDKSIIKPELDTKPQEPKPAEKKTEDKKDKTKTDGKSVDTDDLNSLMGDKDTPKENQSKQDKNPESKTKSNPIQPPKKSRFTFMEFLLFGFGLLVIAAVIAVLVLLFL